MRLHPSSSLSSAAAQQRPQGSVRSGNGREVAEHLLDDIASGTEGDSIDGGKGLELKSEWKYLLR